MKIKFTTEKSVNGVRVIAVDVKAALKGKNHIESHIKDTHYHRKDPWNVITDDLPIKWVDGEPYFNC